MTVLRVVLALAALAAAGAVYALWKRPPRLRGVDLAGMGVRGPAIVEFTTPHCAPCRAAIPHLEAAARASGVTLVQVDVADRPDLARSHRIRTVPTIVVAGRSGRVHGAWTRLPEGDAVLEAALAAR